MKKIISVILPILLVVGGLYAADWSNPNPQGGGDKAGQLLLKHESNMADLYQSSTGKLNLLKDNFAGGTAPASPSEGQGWWDSTNDTLKVYNGTDWSGKVYNAGLLNGAATSILNAPGAIPIANSSGVLEPGWIAAETHSISVHRNNTTQSIPTGVSTKVQWIYEEWDTHSDFDSTTNYRWTPSVAGKYLVTAQISWTTAASVSFVMVRKNGSTYKQGPTSNYGNTYGNVTAIVDMNGTTDYIEIWVLHSTGSSVNINGSPFNTYFQGSKQ